MRCVATIFTIRIFSDKHKTAVYVSLQCNNSSALSGKTAEVQCTSGNP